MGFRQIFGGSTPPKYFTDVVPSDIWLFYTPKILDGWDSVKYSGGLQPQNISRMGFRQIFGGSTPPKNLTDGVPSNIRGVYTPQNVSRMWFRQIFGGCTPPKMFHGWGSVKYLGGLHPQNISRMWFRQIFGWSTPPKYLTDGIPSNIRGVYNPKIFHGWGSVKYLGGLHPQKI